MGQNLQTLIAVAFHNRILAPNLEEAYLQFSKISPRVMSLDAFSAAVRICLQCGLIREPIRLPEGALQCHWHLELTPAGVTAARLVLQNAQNEQSVQDSCTLC